MSLGVDLDIEAVHEASGRTPYERWLAVLVGIAAILAAILATIQVDAGKQQERALLMASRLSVQGFEGIAGSSPRFSFQINSLQQATTLAITGTASQIALFEFPEVADVLSARAAADVKAAERLLLIAQSMGEVPDSSSGIDAAALRLVGASPADLIGVVAEQNRQVDVADRYGERGNRGLFGLSLLALGAVLVGLGAVLESGLPGRVSLAAASLALLAAAAWGGSALLV